MRKGIEGGGLSGGCKGLAHQFAVDGMLLRLEFVVYRRLRSSGWWKTETDEVKTGKSTFLVTF